ncbi:hypothetical protein E2C01_016457 [Portunus trituberculatus]|uniref:Uncharacterized protein n=1 Tax=Portunus trituberculatus TaxID=210409 RepID=A0A5B7DP59_PORTR|nr:hypothetical protein [Portunus trituberculatus]
MDDKIVEATSGGGVDNRGSNVTGEGGGTSGGDGGGGFSDDHLRGGGGLRAGVGVNMAGYSINGLLNQSMQSEQGPALLHNLTPIKYVL